MKIIFEYANEKQEGTIITDKNNELTIKLDSGYNIIVPKKDIKIIKKIKEKENKEKSKKEDEKKEDEKNKSNLPKITILHTGGTIASKVDYETGAVIAKFTAKEIISLFPELSKTANIDSKLIRNMQSDDMRFEHYNIIAKEIKKAIDDKTTGIIITHGTDTLHYTAAALSFMLKNINKPVVLVGSQRSSDRPSSDAASNLLAATKFIKKNIPGVFICMHATNSDDKFSIIDGVHARKMHSSRRDAFRAINNTPYATINNEEVIIHKKELESKLKTKKIDELEIKLMKNVKIGMLYVHPNMIVEEFSNYKKFDGLVLLGTGLGHAPITEVDELTKEHNNIREEIKKLAKKIPVVMALQTIYGRVNMNVYTPGRVLKKNGVIGHGINITPETAYIKLAWLLSNYPVEETKKLYSSNLCGEITERTEKDEYD